MSWTWVVAFLVIVLIGYLAYKLREEHKESHKGKEPDERRPL